MAKRISVTDSLRGAKALLLKQWAKTKYTSNKSGEGLEVTVELDAQYKEGIISEDGLSFAKLRLEFGKLKYGQILKAWDYSKTEDPERDPRVDSMQELGDGLSYFCQHILSLDALIDKMKAQEKEGVSTEPKNDDVILPTPKSEILQGLQTRWVTALGYLNKALDIAIQNTLAEEELKNERLF